MRVLVPLPDRDFDPTEVSVPWRALTSAGHDVTFATEKGARAACDPFMLTGVILGKMGALPENVALYHELERDDAFARPIAYDAIVPSDYALFMLPGGHAKGMRQYLESSVLADRVRAFVGSARPVGAICHGVVALARSGAVKGRTLTSLPKWMERSAYFLTAWKMGDYYRTYPEYVEDEVRRVTGGFLRGPLSADYAHPFVVEDGVLVTARWPGDARAFGERCAAALARAT